MASDALTRLLSGGKKLRARRAVQPARPAIGAARDLIQAVLGTTKLMEDDGTGLAHQAIKLRQAVELGAAARQQQPPAEFAVRCKEMLGAHVTLYAISHNAMRMTAVASSELEAPTGGAARMRTDELLLRFGLQGGRVELEGSGITLQAVSAAGSDEVIGLIEVERGGGLNLDEQLLLAHVAPAAAPLLLERRQSLYESSPALLPALRRHPSALPPLAFQPAAPSAAVAPAAAKLLGLVGGVAGHLQVEPLIRSIRAAAREIMGAEMCTVLLLDAASQELVGQRSDEEGGAPFVLPLHAGLAGYVAQTGEALNLRDAYDDARFDCSMDVATSRRTKAVLCMPIYGRPEGGAEGGAEGGGE